MNDRGDLVEILTGFTGFNDLFIPRGYNCSLISPILTNSLILTNFTDTD
jgi:hypothetical protein